MSARREKRDAAGRKLGLIAVFGLALSSVACGAHGGGMGGMGAMGPSGAPSLGVPGAPGAPAKAPGGTLTVTKMDAPDDMPDEAKTIQVEYAFNKDVVNKDFEKSFDDGFQKKGIDVRQTINARSHFDVKDAKITGTVTYVKKGMGHYSILAADLVAEAHYDADVQVDLDVQMKGDTKNAKDGDWDNTFVGGKPVPIVKNVMPTNIPIAGPLFLHAHFDLSAACDVQVEGNMHATTGVGIAGDVRLAAHYKKDGIEMPNGKKQKFQFEAKTPNFELSPKPFLKVEAKQQRVKGRCSLQPTAVLLLENMVGAKMSVEPYVELEAKKAGKGQPWVLDAQAGVSVTAATDVQFFGRQLKKPKEFTLAEIALTKPGDELGNVPRIVGPAVPPKTGKAAKTEVASAGMLDSALGGGSSASAPAADSGEPKPPTAKSSGGKGRSIFGGGPGTPVGAKPASPGMPKLGGLFGKKKKG